MKTAHIILTILVCSLLGACSTYVDQNGKQRTGLSRTGAAVLQTTISTGVGVASGALMKNQPSWATGGVAGLSGSIASQAINALIPVEPTQRFAMATPRYTGVDNGPLYRQLPNGEFQRVQ